MNRHWAVLVDGKKWSGKLHTDFKLARRKAVRLAKKKKNLKKKVYIAEIVETYKMTEVLEDVRLEESKQSFFN